MRGTFAGLGFDPAPGSAGDVLAAADAMAGAGDRLAGSAASMRAALAPGDWRGPAADGFAATGAPVPGALDSAHGELRDASTALRTWHAQLRTNQQAAERLDAMARQLRTELAEAERAMPAASQAGQAQQHLARLRARLAATLRAAHRLAQRHRREADTAAATLRGTPPTITGWPASGVSGVATDAGGASAWTGQVATITLPGETDPVVALPIGAQPGDAAWPDPPTVPADELPADAPTATAVTDTSAVAAAVPAVSDNLPIDQPATDTTSAAAVIVPTPVPVATPVTPVTAAVPARRPVVARHPDAVRVVTTPAHAAHTNVHASSAPVHRTPTPHRHTTQQDTPIPRGEPTRHRAPESTPKHLPPRQSSPEPTRTPRPNTRPNTPTNTPAATDRVATPSTTAETAAETTTGTAADTAAAAPSQGGVESPTPAPAAETPRPSQPTQQPAEHALPATPGRQVDAVPTGPTGQGRPPTQATAGPTQHGNGADHRKGDHLPTAALTPKPTPGVYTGVVLPAPPQWDGRSVAPLRATGLLPDLSDELMVTFVIAGAVGPALIAESLAASAPRQRAGKRRGRKQNRMRAFLLQPGSEQLVMLTLQGRSTEGWSTRRALFLRAVAQYRRPADVTADVTADRTTADAP